MKRLYSQKVHVLLLQHDKLMLRFFRRHVNIIFLQTKMLLPTAKKSRCVKQVKVQMFPKDTGSGTLSFALYLISTSTKKILFPKKCREKNTTMIHEKMFMKAC